MKCQLCDSWKPPRRMPSPLRTTRAAPRLRLWAVLKRWNHRAILITVAKQSKMWWPARKEFRPHVCPNLLRKRPSNNSFKLSSCIFICLMGWQSPIDPYILRGGSTWSTTKPLGGLSNYDYTVRYCPDQEGIRQIGTHMLGICCGHRNIKILGVVSAIYWTLSSNRPVCVCEASEEM